MANDEDKRMAYLFAKMRITEFVLRELIAESPDRELLKALSARMIEVYENRALFDGMPDQNIESAEDAYRDSFRILFDESLPEK
jgi:hypothetical protein